jgi:hypothetical protein
VTTNSADYLLSPSVEELARSTLSRLQQKGHAF